MMHHNIAHIYCTLYMLSFRVQRDTSQVGLLDLFVKD